MIFKRLPYLVPATRLLPIVAPAAQAGARRLTNLDRRLSGSGTRCNSNRLYLLLPDDRVCIIALMAKNHPKKNSQLEKTFFDFVIYFFAFTTPLFEIPQAYIIYSNQSASDVSTATWIYFAIASMVFLVYAVKQRIKPLILAYVMYLIIEIVIVAGIIRYG